MTVAPILEAIAWTYGHLAALPAGHVASLVIFAAGLALIGAWNPPPPK